MSPTLLQRAETFVVNAKNPVARALVEELRAEVNRLNGAPASHLLERVDAWAEHARGCHDESCGRCAALFNQVVVAHTVWSNTRVVETR